MALECYFSFNINGHIKCPNCDMCPTLYTSEGFPEGLCLSGHKGGVICVTQTLKDVGEKFNV